MENNTCNTLGKDFDSELDELIKTCKALNEVK